MEVKNPWVTYVNRSYLSIKNTLLRRLGKSNPEITDHSESNILVIILSMFAGVAETLNYYIDNMAREAFISTSRKFSSVVKHTQLIDYRIKAANPASANIVVNFAPGENPLKEEKSIDIILPVGFIIPINTRFYTNNGIEFFSIKAITVTENSKAVVVPVEQKEIITAQNLGTTTGNIDQLFQLPNNYVHNSVFITIDGDPWERVETLGLSGPTDKHYVVDIGVDQNAYIRFGDNVNGAVPAGGGLVVADFYVTLGEGGNVDAYTITNTDFDFAGVHPNMIIPSVYNPLSATAGFGFETIERIRRSAPLSLRTLDRAVTRQDYKDIAKLAPGVDLADIFYNCGKYIRIYISPIGGGIAQEPLLLSTKDYIDQRKMVTTFTQVLPAGESYIHLNLIVTAKFRRDPVSTYNDVIEALIEKYRYESSDINRKIRLSDIIALVDNLEKVDYLILKTIHLKPYIRPMGSYPELLHSIEILPGSNTINRWEVQFDGTLMRFLKNGVHQGNTPLGVPWVDPTTTINITILPNGYSLGQSWEFTTYPVDKDIEVDDFSVPILLEENIELEVVEQYIAN